LSLTLDPDESVQVAMTTSTTVSLVKNTYKDIIIHPSPATAKLVGVAVSAIPANQYGWIQTWGPCAVLTQGTVVINEVVVDSATVDGAVAPMGLTEGQPNTGAGQNAVGVVMEVAANTEHSLVFLTIDP